MTPAKPRQRGSEMSLVERAKELAYRAHAGQVDKAGRPYIEHVARVAAAVSDDPEAEAVAWLHDVLEDQPAYEQECWHVLPSRLITPLLLLSRNTLSGVGYYARVRVDAISLRVKLADIADNANEARLALLPPDVADRLRKKYAKAREALGVEEPK